MKSHGVQIGSTVKLRGHRKLSGMETYIIAKASKHKVTLFAPESGLITTISRREYNARQLKCLFLFDEAWRYIASEEQISQYNNRVMEVEQEVTTAFLSCLKRKGWRVPTYFDGTGFAVETVPTPAMFESLGVPRSRKYQDAVAIGRAAGKAGRLAMAEALTEIGRS